MTLSQLLSVPKWIATFAIGFGFFVSQTPDSAAQCATPDGLDPTTCCAPATPNLPSFPIIVSPASGLCWQACNPLPKTCLTIDLTAPVTTMSCTQYTADLSALDCSGVSLMKGTVTLDYARTWTETPVAGAVPIQVWRFMAKVDLQAGGPISTACPVPNCTAAPGSTAFYYGYVDYSRDCSTGAWSHALVLYHNCYRFVHNSALSATPGAFHPGRTFALVSPDTAANPFVPNIILPGPAPLLGEAMRSVNTAAAGFCLAEEKMIQGAFIPQVTGCACPLSFQPPMNSANRFDGSAACGGGFMSLNVYPTVPWVHLMTTSLGHWSNASSYPGPEFASVAEGLLVYRDACIGPANQSFDIFYGSLTNFGYGFVPTQPLAPPSQNFLDLASNYSVLLTSPLVLPAVGKVAPTDHMIYVNL